MSAFSFSPPGHPTPTTQPPSVRGHRVQRDHLWPTLLLSGLLSVGGGCAAGPGRAQPRETAPPPLTAAHELDLRRLPTVEIRNLQNVRLGRIHDLSIDLERGGIIEVLVEVDPGLFTRGHIVAVPPRALSRDPNPRILRLNMSREVFDTAPTVDLADWAAAERNHHVAATYRFFGQEPDFVESGTIMVGHGVRFRSMLGYVERASRFVGLPVTNPTDVPLGTVSSLRVDVVRGKVTRLIVTSIKNRSRQSHVPPEAFRFNARRDGLILGRSQSAASQ